MTGFGSAQQEGEKLTVAVEVRSVNNRFLKINLRAPDPYHLLESEIEKAVRKHIRRGTLQVHLRCEAESPPTDYKINITALHSYLEQLEPIIQKNGFAGKGEFLLTQVLSLPGVVLEPASLTSRLEEDWPVIHDALQKALTKLQCMRSDEGKAMKEELLSYREQLLERLGNIKKRIPHVTTAFRDRLYERVRAILEAHDVELDHSDIIKEVSIFSERSDIAEEVIRLESHLDQFQEFMNEKESAGRKLDFLTQELLREANTTGAKSGDVEISRQVVEIKGVLEKIRELVQNIE